MEPSSSDLDKSLASLFASEAFLYRVFMHLIEDGLHECRLVCRAWNNTVKKLPVRLSLSDEKRTALVLKTFPNAVLIKTSGRIVFSYLYRTAVDEALLRHFAPMKQLTRLEIRLQGSFVLSEEFERCFQSMPQLQFLEVRLPLAKLDAYRFYEALRHLTNLSSLAVNHWDNPVFQAAPLTELEKIQYLDCSSYKLMTDSDILICPSLTRLTHLTVSLLDNFVKRCGESSFLQALLPYAETLESLSIHGFPSEANLMRNMSLLTRFVGLTSLEVRHPPVEDTDLYEVLKMLPKLRDLKLLNLRHTAEAALRAVLSLTWLESLYTTPHHGSYEAYNPVSISSEISALTNLTRLQTSSALINTAMSTLTRLEHLEITVLTGIRVPPCFRAHTNLEALTLFCGEDLYLPKGILSHFRKLKRLRICEVVMDDTVLPSIAALPLLTSLNFRSAEEWKESYFAQVNLLSNLVRLTFLVASENRNPMSYITAGSLPRLQYLEVFSENEADLVLAQLRQKVPCLRRFSACYCSQ